MAKKLILLAVAAVLALAANAYDFIVDGLCYSVADEGKVCVVGATQSPTGALTIPNEVTYNGNSYSVTQVLGFRGCSGLTSVTLPKSVTRIGVQAFMECENLKSVNIPNSVTTIDQEAFYDSGIVSVALPNSVKSIGNKAFYQCREMRSLSIYNSVTHIGNNAFAVCDELMFVSLLGDGDFLVDNGLGISSTGFYGQPFSLYIDSKITGIAGLKLNPNVIYCFAENPPACNENTFTAYTATLHVPENATANYILSDYWNNFSNISNDVVELQSLTISQSEAVLEVGDPLNLTVTANPTNYSPYSSIGWYSTNPSVAIVRYYEYSSYTGPQIAIVTAVGSGECDIVANAFFQKAVCHVIVQETRIAITLDMDNATIQPNKILIVYPTCTPDAAVDFTVSSSDPTVAFARVIDRPAGAPVMGAPALASTKAIQIVGIKDGTATVTVGSADGKATPATIEVTVQTVTGVEDINVDNSGKHQRYNVLGQPVDDSYRGVVIENGKKIMVQ